MQVNAYKDDSNLRPTLTWLKKMQQLIIGFFLTAIFSLAIMPWVIRVSIALHVVDVPTKRKVHTHPVPRLGGCGIFLTFSSVLLLLCIFRPASISNYFLEPGNLFFVLGALVAFGVGLYDDFKRLPARYKLIFQIFAASLAYAGGVRIESIGLRDLFVMDLGYASPFISIFWVVLVINAINFMDGLDGLAGGISLVVICFLCYISFIGGHFGTALMLALLGGSIFGFLRYNFNPASVFMGDGGSYFLGYMLATFSALISIENQSTLTIFIPMIALALPIVDVTMSTIRRFIHGKAIFSPDKMHFHHMLLQRGFSQRGAVLVLYGVAILISIFALLLMQVHIEKSLAILVILSLLVLIGIGKLGYFKYYDKSSFFPWIGSIIDEAGLSRKRRSFFDIQIQIDKSTTLPELWCGVEKASLVLKFINCAIYLHKNGLYLNGEEKTAKNRRRISALSSTVTLRKSPPDWSWINPEMELDENNRSLFRMEVALTDKNSNKFGTLVMIKDQSLSPVDHYTLKRIEQLRRSIIKALNRIQQESATLSPKEKSKGRAHGADGVIKSHFKRVILGLTRH